MKKIIALALALIMALSMASVAYAEEAQAPQLTFKYEAEEETCIVELEEGYAGHLLPGNTYALDVDGLEDVAPEDGGADAQADEFKPAYTAKNWTVDADWEVGGALVAGIAYNKDKEVWELTLNENYTIAAAKRLEGELTFSPKGVAKKALADVEDPDVVVTIKEVVSNHLVEKLGEEDVDDVLYEDACDNTIYICVEDEAGYVGFNSGKLLSVLLDMESEEKVFAYNDEELIAALAEKFPEADIECYNFGTVRTLKNEAELTLQADYADQYYVYTYNKGVLEAQDYTWNSVDGVYEWTSKTLGSFVISDVELVAAEEETKNPDTGANDVVGVAAALAVVSLVAGAAVSLKK